jgi:hypothetical protein
MEAASVAGSGYPERLVHGCTCFAGDNSLSHRLKGRPETGPKRDGQPGVGDPTSWGRNPVPFPIPKSRSRSLTLRSGSGTTTGLATFYVRLLREGPVVRGPPQAPDLPGPPRRRPALPPLRGGAGVQIGDRPAHAIVAADLEGLVASLKDRGCKPNYTARICRAIKAAWAWAARPTPTARSSA